MSKVILHRKFEGEHEMSENCWCDPVVTDADDLRDSDELIAETETDQG